MNSVTVRHKNVLNFFRNIRALATSNNAFNKISVTSDEDSLNYCANLVKQHDYENFLATLLMTKALRSPVLVVRAFNVEVARVQDQTRDLNTAAFRLQFWYDALNDIYKKDQLMKHIPANPVAQELFKVCSCYNLPKRYLERLINARNNILKQKHFRTLEDLEKYAEESVSTLYYLMLGVADVKNVNADHAASHLGKAQGIANMLRSIQISNYHKMVSLPMETLMKHKISQESVLRGVDNESMRNAIYEIATRANSHLQKARSISVPKISYQLFLPAIAVDSYLTKLQKCNFNVYDKSLQRRSAMLPVSLYYNRLLNKF